LAVHRARELRTVHIDTIGWTSFVHARLAVAMGDRPYGPYGGCSSLLGTKAEAHRLLSEHRAAEYRFRTEARGRTADDWKLKASAADNRLDRTAPWGNLLPAEFSRPRGRGLAEAPGAGTIPVERPRWPRARGHPGNPD